MNLNKEVDEFVARCLDYQQVKVECKHPNGLLQPISIPEWKWQVISIEFIIGQPRTLKKYDSIMVVVDRLSKVAHFIAVKSTNSASQVAQIFIREIVRLHGVPKKIISNRDAKFTSMFLKELFASLGKKLAFSTTHHLQTDGQTKRINRILEDMLMVYVMHHQRKWEEYLPLVEFAYNKGYQGSLKMSSFKALYGLSCNNPISQSDLMNRVLIGPDMLAEVEQEIQVIKMNLKEAQDRQKIYVQHRAFKELQVGEHVYSRIKPKKSSLRIGSCAKLAP